MNVTFWGVRGSLPAALTPGALKERLGLAIDAARAGGAREDTPDAVLERLPAAVADTVGGDTSCVAVSTGPWIMVFDAGTGMRRLGLSLMDGPCGKGEGRIDLFVSHTHWDHIMGLPFFAPVHTPGNVITARSPLPNLKERLARLFQTDHFPVPWEAVEAVLRVEPMAENEPLTLGSVTVRALRMPHPGGSYAFRVEEDNTAFVYATDVEWGLDPPYPEETYYEFFRGADLLVFDSQYTEEEAAQKPGWGHSTPPVAVDIALRSGAKRLALFHHEPAHDDADIEAIAEQAREHLRARDPGSDLEIILARQGLVIEL